MVKRTISCEHGNFADGECPECNKKREDFIKISTTTQVARAGKAQAEDIIKFKDSEIKEEK